jgi:hypothetical protein
MTRLSESMSTADGRALFALVDRFAEAGGAVVAAVVSAAVRECLAGASLAERVAQGGLGTFVADVRVRVERGGMHAVHSALLAAAAGDTAGHLALGGSGDQVRDLLESPLAGDALEAAIDAGFAVLVTQYETDWELTHARINMPRPGASLQAGPSDTYVHSSQGAGISNLYQKKKKKKKLNFKKIKIVSLTIPLGY